MAYRFLLEVPRLLADDANIAVTASGVAQVLVVRPAHGAGFDDGYVDLSIAAQNLGVIDSIYDWYEDAGFDAPGNRASVSVILHHGQQLPLGDDNTSMLLRILSFNLGVELGQIAALAAMVALLTLWRHRPSFKRFSYVANLGLFYAGVYLLFMQLHGYQHDVDPDSFRFPATEHQHIHEDMDIQNSTDNSRNTL